jgi:hypothetical protein
LRTNNRETDKKPIPELGFRFDAWNGNFGDPASIMVTCGVYSKHVSNAVVLNLPRRILEESAAYPGTLVDIFVDSWEPEKTVAGQLDGTTVERIWKAKECIIEGGK